MSRIRIAVALLLAATVPAAAQSALIDLSTPMTGKARFVLNADGTPADLPGEAALAAADAARRARIEAEAEAAAQEAAAASAAAFASAPTSQQVAEPTRTRAARGSTFIFVHAGGNACNGKACAAGAARPQAVSAVSRGGRRSGFRLRRR